MLKLFEIKNMIKNAIKENKVLLKHRNVIIVGENSSGKSTLLKNIINNDGTEYVIDSVNRKVIDNNKEIKSTFSDLNLKEIVKNRLSEDFFNKKDTFNKLLGTELIVNELKNNLNKYQKLFFEIFKITLEEDIKLNSKEKTFNNIIEEGNLHKESLSVDGINIKSLSDGIQAKLRLLMEINYALENNCKTIYIDEFDISFDTANTSDIIKKILNYYKNYNIRLILTTHSPYAVRDLNDFDIIKIYMNYDDIFNNPCEIYDGNDLDNLEIIDKKLFYRESVQNCSKKEKDIFLSNILKKKICGILTKEEIININKLTDLSLKQEILKKFILEEK